MKHSGPYSRCLGMPRNYYATVTSRMVRCKNRNCRHEQLGSALRCPVCGDYMVVADVRIAGEINRPLAPVSKIVRKPRPSALAIILEAR